MCCNECPCIDEGNTGLEPYCLILKTIIYDGNSIHKDCTMIEIKSPHGRLIDADELYKRIERVKHLLSCDAYAYGYIAGIGSYVQKSSTIIEAEANQVEFDYQDDKIINDEHTIAELPQEEYIKKIEQMEVPNRPHPFDIK